MTTSGAADGLSMPVPDPNFVAHFTDRLYHDPADSYAPFGSDEGADMLADWAERRDELGPDSTVADILEDDPAESVSDPDDYFSQVFVQAAGFTLLYLTGHIDPVGKRATIQAIRNMIKFVGGKDPVLLKQLHDLQTWGQ